MWSTLGINDVDLLSAWVGVMLQMDPSYAGLTVDSVRLSMAAAQVRIYYYQGDGFQIALRFTFDNARGNWQWTNLGFVGDVTPAAALDLCIAQYEQFLTEQEQTQVTAVCPKSIAYQPLGQLYDLAKEDSRLQISVLYESPTAYVWQIDYVGD